MEFGDERKIPNLYTGEYFGQFPNRGRQVERVKKTLFLRWSLKILFQTELERTEWTDGERYEITLPEFEVIQT